MSNNKKPTQYLIKAPPASETASVPPRYQPPPQPPQPPGPPGGILKPLQTLVQRDAAVKVPHYPPDTKLHTQPHPSGFILAYPGPSRPSGAQQRPPGNQHVRLSDDELLRLGPVEMLKFVRKTEGESVRASAEQSRHLQALATELRSMKEANQRLSDDNQELRDLCCFLDDDRQKGRKLAREWQRFGRYTASVMRQEVSAYQSKLRQLDDKQQELIRDNLELKELCLYLDEERAVGLCTACRTSQSGTGTLRDDGDGSSCSTNADDPLPQFAGRERLLNDSLQRQYNAFNDQTMQYVRSLERKVQQLEEERRTLQGGGTTTDPLTGRPEAVVRALQVLEVREQLEREREAVVPDHGDNSEMDDGEKALVREMCNVVWRKLEEGPAAARDM